MRTNDNRDVDQATDGVGFEEMYARAALDFDGIPWAALTAHPDLVALLDRQPTPTGRTALVIGCGLGDDAEELARRGYRVTGFDVSPTAIEWCRHRFPGSVVDYRVADVFALPKTWTGGFDLVVEIRTLQSLPTSRRVDAATAIAGTVRSGGQIFVHCLGRSEHEPTTTRPWPLSRAELHTFIDAGLQELHFVERTAQPGHGRSFTALYARAAADT